MRSVKHPALRCQSLQFILDLLTVKQKDGRRLIKGNYGKVRWIPQTLCDHVLHAKAADPSAGGRVWMTDDDWCDRFKLPPDLLRVLEDYEWLSDSLDCTCRLVKRHGCSRASERECGR